MRRGSSFRRNTTFLWSRMIRVSETGVSQLRRRRSQADARVAFRLYMSFVLCDLCWKWWHLNECRHTYLSYLCDQIFDGKVARGRIDAALEPPVACEIARGRGSWPFEKARALDWGDLRATWFMPGDIPHWTDSCQDTLLAATAAVVVNDVVSNSR